MLPAFIFAHSRIIGLVEGGFYFGESTSPRMPGVIEVLTLAETRQEIVFPEEDDSLVFFHLSGNDRIVFEALKCVGSASRSDLIKLCALPSTTIYDALVRLVLLGLVERHTEKRTKRGRPKTFYLIR